MFQFQGISPKLEFATKTVIKESLSPEVDALEDALEQERVSINQIEMKEIALENMK